MKKIQEITFINNLWKKHGYNLFILVGILGIMLIFLSETTDNKEKYAETETSTFTYKKQIETEMSDLLSLVNGAGKVKVMVTLESGEENIYVWQEKTSEERKTVSADSSRQESIQTSYENEIVTIDKNGQKNALIEKTLQPVIQGVVVVCQGADDIKVVSDITDAVSVALNVSTNRICVIKME